MSKLEISTRSQPHTGTFREVIMTLSGSLNATTVPIFEREISHILSTKPQRIILETSAVEHIHGGALEFLAKAHKEQTLHQGEFLIVNKHPVVDSIHLEKTESGGVQIVRLAGNLDIRGVDRIEAEFLRVFDVPSPRVLVDFSATDSLSSLGIRMVLEGIKNATTRGGKILILNPAPPASSALEVAGLGQFIARGEEGEIVAGLRQ